MKSRWVAAAAALLLCGATLAQAPLKRVERAADLPRFTYPVAGEVEALVRDPAKFSAFARQVYADAENVLATHDIAELATRRQLLGLLMQIDLLEGRWDAALQRAEQIRGLQEKPSDKLLSGLSVRAMVAAVRKTGSRDAPGYAAEVARVVAEELAPLPPALVRNDVIRLKAGMETAGEATAVGRVREVLQPVAAKSGALSSDLAPSVVSARYVLTVLLPLKATFVDAYTAYLDRTRVEKPDIWAARDVALPAAGAFTPVTIVVWDSGIDSGVFPGRMVLREGKPALVAFDLHQRPSASELSPSPRGCAAACPNCNAVPRACRTSAPTSTARKHAK